MKTGKLSTAAKVLAVSIALCGAGSVSALTLTGSSGPDWLRSPGSYSFSFLNGSGYTSGQLSFDLLGNRSLDGLNGIWTDIFTLSVNSMPIFAGSFNMGGGGSSYALGPSGTTWNTTSPGFFQGGATHVSLPISLLEGSNTIRFAYTGLPQGLRDEGWKVGSYTVTAVPEPETYAMLLAGLGLVGAMARRRRKG
jgi:subtilisin family serine protease